ncbi:hypothetical protein APE_0240 [Aeropyrum pernix K1]|uniref:Uncharacterized protein n=1 Tax=Aeropyrum pernix (strain ATCC 700893 / DSM 11879 / JCM 9820 / NBRC 100138 / K1) TaxID=272557 RepID=Q9YFK8_AERPE|nr:hypothetical protein [Aeropyrum pernix]BAA79153.1 hypothetical protein APE_0240 [Aeropyrum pernix K1]
MLLKNEQRVKVDVDNSKVLVSGRRYEASHTLLVGTSGLSAEIEPGSVRVSAYFSQHPEVEYVNEDLVKVYSAGSRYEVDTLGEKVAKVESGSNRVELQGDIISIKFEVDSEIVTLKLPKGGRLKSAKLKVRAEGDVSLNVITFPFTMGILTARKSKATVTVKGDVIELVVEPLKQK